jgi:hypothetical protein
MSPEILKGCSLSSILCIEDQIKFLDMLIATKGPADKKELIDQALAGEKVWQVQEVV